jgi:hypothetical protein
MSAVEQIAPSGATAPSPPGVAERIDERAARHALRGQIARLERELTAIALHACPRLDPGPPLPSLRGPRLLSLGELERIRDALAARLGPLEAAAGAQEARQAAAHALLERMYADPRGHKWVRLSNDDLGKPLCGHYHVRPRFGVLGFLLDWWEVKVSSGCPLPWGP